MIIIGEINSNFKKIVGGGTKGKKLKLFPHFWETARQ